MRGGLRLQILLLLGGLLLLAFVPLFYAVATYTSVTLQQLRVGHARALGRAIAAHVAEARTSRCDIVAGLPQQVLLVTHHLDLLDGFDRVLVFDEGRLVCDDLPGEAVGFYRKLMR